MADDHPVNAPSLFGRGTQGEGFIAMISTIPRIFRQFHRAGQHAATGTEAGLTAKECRAP